MNGLIRRWEKLGVRSAWLLALLAPPAAAAAMTPLRSHTQTSNLALVMVLVVAASVVPGYRLAALAGGVSAGIWFDFFLTRPYQRLSISDTLDVQTTLLMAVVAVAVGAIAARRRQAREAAQRSGGEVLDLYVAAQMLSGGAAERDLVDTVAAQLKKLLFLTDCRFDRRGPALTEPLIDRGGELDWAGNTWSLTSSGWPDGAVSLPIYCSGRPVGRFLLTGPGRDATRDEALTVDRLLTAVALSDVAGAALGGTLDGRRPGPVLHLN